MHLIDLVDELKSTLEELFRDYNYENKESELKPPTIRTGWYTTKKKEDDFPYILISPEGQKDSLNDSKIKVYLIIGMYSNDAEEGWKNVALVMNKIRLYFESITIYAKKYSVLKDISMSFPDDQPYPQWFGLMELNFEAYNVADTSIDFDNFFEL